MSSISSGISVWIPAQTTSTRCKLKNFRDFFNGKSLLQILINKLEKIDQIREIVVSTDSTLLAGEQLSEYQKCVVTLRPEELLGNNISQKHLIKHFSDVGSNSDTILIAQCTDPLFDDYQGLIDAYFEMLKLKSLNFSLAVATEMKKQVFYNGICLNGELGLYHRVTQTTTPIYVNRWSGFIASHQGFLNCGYQLLPEYEFYLSNEPIIDIDTETDFSIAQKYFQAAQ